MRGDMQTDGIANTCPEEIILVTGVGGMAWSSRPPVFEVWNYTSSDTMALKMLPIRKIHGPIKFGFWDQGQEMRLSQIS
jgi:hypothetical protein